MEGYLSVFNNAAFFLFLILGKSHKETAQIIDLCHFCFFIVTFKKFDLAKKCSEEKALNYLFY